MTQTKAYYLYHRGEMIQADPNLFSLDQPFPDVASLESRDPAIGIRPGVFTTSRTYRRGEDAETKRIPFLALDYHLERFLSDAKSLELLDPLTPWATKSWLEDKVHQRLRTFLREHSPQTDAKFRLVLRRPDTLEFWIEVIEPDNLETYRLKSVPAKRELPQHKTNYLQTCRSAHSAALSLGYDEALLTGERNIVTECAWANFFWVDTSGVLRTAPSEVLPGVIRRMILEEHHVMPENATLDEVQERAVEAFITNSRIGVRAVSAIDERTLPSAPGPRTAEIQRWFEEKLR